MNGMDYHNYSKAIIHLQRCIAMIEDLRFNYIQIPVEIVSNKHNKAKNMEQKIRRALAELSQECTALSHQEMGSVVGGDIYRFDHSSGYLIGIEKSDENIVMVGELSLALDGGLSGLSMENPKNVTFDGPGTSKELFEFLAKNTAVEWGYAYNSGGYGGVMMTSNDMHKIDLGSGRTNTLKNYDYYVHNHGNKPDNMSARKAQEFNSRPSEDDVKYFDKEGMPQGQIYNELTEEYYNFDQKSNTQEDWLRDNGYEYVVDEKGNGIWRPK